MGSYKWGYNQGSYGFNPIRGLTTPFITTPEPPSMAGNVALEAARWVSGARAMDRTMFGREVPEQYPETPISLN